MKTTMILSFILSVMLLSCDHGEQEIIVVPKNFTGYILIIFNQKNGAPPKYESKTRVYEIPQDGVLKTQFEGNYGWVGFPEYYYERIVPENKLPSFVELNKVPIDTVVAYGGSTGTIKKSSKSEERIEFAAFYIGNKAQIEQAREQVEKLDILKLAEE